MIDFLDRCKYFVLTLVLVTIPLFGYLALGNFMFLGDALTAGICLIVPVVQIASYAIAWKFLEDGKYIRLSAWLMALSVLPTLALLIIWIYLKIILR